jgi:preprotein translocase subunit YajC
MGSCAPMEYYKYGTQFLMILGVALAFYVALIKPQLDRISTSQEFLENLKIGDHVVTTGGLIGKIVRFEGGQVVVLALSEALQVRVVRDGIENYFEPDAQNSERTAADADHSAPRVTSA